MTNLYNIFLQSTGISTDSRNIVPGSVFFALKGGNFDGNDYAAHAIREGAVVAVVDNPDVTASDKYIVVLDSLKALQELALLHRNTVNPKVLAITGSNGKTTTKELVSAVLAKKYKISVTVGNFNNHIGVPLTLLGLKTDTEIAVVEMGASGPGEIADLCEIARPDYGIITNIGKAHLEGFKDIEGVGRAKSELYSYLSQNGGLAFVRKDDPVLCDLAGKFPELQIAGYESILGAGYKTSLEGSYNLLNIAAAVAIGNYFSVSDDSIRMALSSYIPSNHRSQRIDTVSNTVIADCYNANPASMSESVKSFADNSELRPRIAILGSMKELGMQSVSEHRAILDMISDLNIDRILLVGIEFRDAAHERGYEYFEDVEHLTSYLTKNPISDSNILVKGSRATGLDKILRIL